MIQSTSLEAYYRIKEDGLLSRLRFEVYEAIVKIGRPITQGEIQEYFFPSIKGAGGSVGGRFSELERRGVIKSIGTRQCEITGNNKLIYIPTNELPVNPPKFKSKKQVSQEALTKAEDIKKNAYHIMPLQLDAEMSDIIELLKQLIK